MSSTIFYKFLHQRDQSTVHFDGTSISVFDLKHEIIVQNQLGQGNDFMLRLYHSEQPSVEYEHDQDVIPRSTFVLAKRSPSSHKNGKFNNASRYISGKPRINRRAISNQSTAPSASVNDPKILDESMAEEDRIKMMFENQENAWAQTQDELSTHKLVYNKPTSGSNPEDLPPPGYICYRCGAKDHWIRNCPTNTDPNFEGKKIKRTTGIPRSYLKTISKEAVENQGQGSENGITTNENGELVDTQGNTYMITDSGEYVIAMADSKTWNAYQEKQQNAAMKAKQEFDKKILECAQKDEKWEYLDPLSGSEKLLEPSIVMTPCCRDKSRLKKLRNFNYNEGILEQVLIDNDFHCPNCGAEDIFIDSLIPNKELEQEMTDYIDTKKKEIGVEDPVTSMKRMAESSEGNDPKRVKMDFSSMPNMIPPPFFGMPPAGIPMPPMPMPIPGPMFLPPTPFSQNNVNTPNEQSNGNK